MGSEGKILFDTITDMASMKEKTTSIVQDMIDTPDKAHANMQELMAKMNPCVKARKCNLVPFKRTTIQARKSATAQVVVQAKQATTSFLIQW